jgi:hypothetical protein
MKKFALIFTLFIGVAVVTQGQDQKVKVKVKGSPTTRSEAGNYDAVANAETDKLDKIVILTPDQRAAINSINVSLARRAEIINANNPANKAELLTQLENARTNMYMQKLTDEQKLKYKATFPQKQ